MTKVSIIIPVYNAEKTLPRCLEAILKQTYQDFEAICVNDGSKDNSLQILEKYSKLDSRIKIFNQENSGPAKTRNFAISKACGQYLMFCDSDDWYEPTMIEKMVDVIESKSVDLVMCDCNIHNINDSNLIPKDYLDYCHIKIKEKMDISIDNFYKINVLLWNKIFKREILEQNNITYPKKYEHDDDNFIVKYLLSSKSYYGIEEKLYNYIIGNAESIMGKYYTKTNKKSYFDFIYNQIDIYSWIKTEFGIDTSLKYLNIFKNKYINFYSKLSQENKPIAIELLIKFIKENPEVKSQVFFKKIEFISKSKFKNLDAYIIDNITSIEKVFSLKNKYIDNKKYKILYFLGKKYQYCIKDNKNINIIFSMDENVYKIALVSMLSILKNNKLSNINIYILHSKLSNAAIKNICKLNRYKNCSIYMHEMNEQNYIHYPLPSWLTPAAYYRIFAAEIFSHVNKFLYLDCDTLCNGNIESLYDFNLEGKTVGVVQDLYYRERSETLKINDNNYFNSGVMLIDCQSWRDRNYTSKLVEYLEKECDFEINKYADQDVLNVVLKNDKRILDPKYNYLEPFNPKEKYEYIGEYEKLYLKAKKSPIIIHFIGPKPFDKKCINSHKNKWITVANNFVFFNQYFQIIKSLLNEVFSVAFDMPTNHYQVKFLFIKMKFKKRRK